MMGLAFALFFIFGGQLAFWPADPQGMAKNPLDDSIFTLYLVAGIFGALGAITGAYTILSPKGVLGSVWELISSSFGSQGQETAKPS